MAGMLKQRLFGEMPEPPKRTHIEMTVTSAVDVFLSAYGRSNISRNR